MVKNMTHHFTNSKAGMAVKVALLAIMLAVFECSAYASEGGTPATMDDWIKRTIHFVVLAGIMFYVFNKHIKGALKKRVDDIETALAEAKAAKDDALKKLADVEARLKNKDAETQSLIDRAAENGRKERELLIAEGERMNQDILSSAKDNIGAELNKAKEEIRREAALKAVELAEQLIKDNITKDDRARILDEYIAKVGG